ncbi:leucine-rich repeat-containing protein [Gigaspora margarita]|uniref:Leucine-rich repeat-containing protein n=1 Tax=Gigaspora margarita TaxID=4874 RepID=A0A8H3XBU7_GIGMA|nr:leucine-rich repeat-containing protein [Gigaspora margarita]
MEKRMKEQESGIEKLMKEIAANKEAWSQKEADLISNYEYKLQDKDSEIEELQEELETIQNESIDLKNLLEEEKTQIKNLEIKLQASELETHKTNTQISDLQCKLANAMNDNELLQRKATELKKILEKQASEEELVKKEELIDKESEIRDLKKKLADEREERNKIGSRFKELEQLITRAEEQLEAYRNEKQQLIQEHQVEIQKLQNQHEEEINKLSLAIQTRIESLEKRQRQQQQQRDRLSDRSDRGETKRISILEQRIIELDQSLKVSEAEREKLQNEKNELDVRFQEVLSKNVTLVVQMANHNK